MSDLKRKRRQKQFDPELLTTLAYFDAESAYRYARIAKRTYYQAISDGKLRAFRVGGNGKLIAKREDLDHFLTAAPAEAKLDSIVNEALADLESGK